MKQISRFTEKFLSSTKVREGDFDWHLYNMTEELTYEQEALRQNIIAQQEEPFSRLAFGQNLLAGLPTGTTTLAQVQQPNPYLTALQTGILGLGVLSGQGGGNLGSFLTGV